MRTRLQNKYSSRHTLAQVFLLLSSSLSKSRCRAPYRTETPKQDAKHRRDCSGRCYEYVLASATSATAGAAGAISGATRRLFLAPGSSQSNSHPPAPPHGAPAHPKRRKTTLSRALVRWQLEIEHTAVVVGEKYAGT